MDTHNNMKKADSICSADFRNHRVVVGSKQLRKALARGTAKTVFLAENADPAITGPIETLCADHRVKCVWVPSSAELGKACGIEVAAAAAAVID